MGVYIFIRIKKHCLNILNLFIIKMGREKKVSKKVSEFDRYERMKKMEKEAEVEKRRNNIEHIKQPKRQKNISGGKLKINDFDYYEEEYI